MDLVLIRILFVLILTAACFFLRPFALQPWTAAVLGAAAAAAVIVFELRVRALSIKRLLGAVLGSVLGIAGAALFGMVLSGSLPPGGTRACCSFSCSCSCRTWGWWWAPARATC